MKAIWGVLTKSVKEGLKVKSNREEIVDEVMEQVRIVEELEGWENTPIVSKEEVKEVYKGIELGKEKLGIKQSKVLRVYIEMRMAKQLKESGYRLKEEKVQELERYLGEMEYSVGDHLEIGISGSNAIQVVLKRTNELFKEISEGVELTGEDVKEISKILGKKGLEVDKGTIKILGAGEIVKRLSVGIYGGVSYEKVSEYIDEKEVYIKEEIAKKEAEKELRRRYEEEKDEDKERYERVKYIIGCTESERRRLGIRVVMDINGILIESDGCEGIEIGVKGITSKGFKNGGIRRRRSQSLLLQVVSEWFIEGVRGLGYSKEQSNYIIGVLSTSYDLRKKIG